VHWNFFATLAALAVTVDLIAPPLLNLAATSSTSSTSSSSSSFLPRVRAVARRNAVGITGVVTLSLYQTLLVPPPLVSRYLAATTTFPSLTAFSK
jgi:hypothetical protein